MSEYAVVTEISCIYFILLLQIWDIIGFLFYIQVNAAFQLHFKLGNSKNQLERPLKSDFPLGNWAPLSQLGFLRRTSRFNMATPHIYCNMMRWKRVYFTRLKM